MAKKANAVPANQKSLDSFFTGGKMKRVKDSDNEDASSDLEQTAPTTVVNNAKAAPDASTLPPISRIPEIFADLVSNAPEIASVGEHLKGRKMRVATMCSGTESPLLALDLMRRAIREQYDVDLDVEHVFSCEIEPFKQAYIERNFSPPILFRDVCELGQDRATTAYGAEVEVPGDVDLLVAGTSCVDYSNLNNEKQDLEANGESGRTFRGMMSWVDRHRPPLVILENVCSAPWDKVKVQFERIGYSAAHQRVDTKNFYIPHTRTRVYLIAVNEKKSSLPEKWLKMVGNLKRPASCTLDAFMLASDDPRIHQAREKLVNESYNALDRRTGRTDWSRCEARHQRARLTEDLGSKRPLTNWDENAFCKLPDFAWNDWGVGQVQRVWDLMDISLLRAALKGVDPSYKSQVWNLSQNVDRSTGSSRPGICPCLTPSMIPYITNRGGPMVGLEALSMQGLPVDELILTRETEDQLADLAGNAMSTTVVGACILSALIIGKKHLKKGQRSSETTDSEKDTMDIDKPTSTVLNTISGEEKLITQTLDISAMMVSSLGDLLSRAERSRRLCECEGRINTTDRQVRICVDCGSSACIKCGGRPEHNFQPVDIETKPRISPSQFALELKGALPMCLGLEGITSERLEALKESSELKVSDERWNAWSEALLRAASSELRFIEAKRQEIWSAVYESPHATMHLLLHPQRPQWTIFAKAEDSEPANSDLRKLLAHPVARLVCEGSVLQGKFEFSLPHAETVALTITGAGELVPSWEAKLGLLTKRHRDSTVHSQLGIKLPEEKKPLFDRDISGVYQLFDKCGTANSALHKRIAEDGEESLPPIFLMLDPTRTGEPEEDGFVFTTSTRRYEYGEARPIICTVDKKWRQSNKADPQAVKCYIQCKWVGDSDVAIQPHRRDGITSSTPSDTLDLDINVDACESASALLVCQVPVGPDAGTEWPRGHWLEVDKVHERSTFKSLAWLTERTRTIAEQFSHWQPLHTTDDEHLTTCSRCAPQPPRLEWLPEKKKWVGREKTSEAGSYERALKKRPAPFVTQLKLDEESGVGTVRIGVNFPSLVHKALSRLPKTMNNAQPRFSWRLDTNFTPQVKLSLPKFQLLSNRQDPQHAQPPSFKVKLRPEQCRSLTWMLEREAVDAEPFVEEEIAEAILEPLGWRAEGRAERPIHIRGGVLADQVGYGKTAITLGLMDCAAKDVDADMEVMEEMPGKIPVRATLAVVPAHLTLQWASEAEKFCPGRFKKVVISTATNINSLTIQQVQEADIVIVASNLFKSSVYLANLEAFAAGGSLPPQEGRFFDARLDEVMTSLRGQVDRLQRDGSEAVIKEIHEARRRDDEAIAAAKQQVQLKRLKGKQYRNAVETKTGEDPITKPEESSSSVKPSGRRVEVVIPKMSESERNLYSGSSSPTSVPASLTSEASTDVEMEDAEDSDAPRPRRKLSKKVIVVPDSDSEEEVKPKRQAKQAKRKAPAKRSKKKEDSDFEEDDYEVSSAEESAAATSDVDGQSMEEDGESDVPAKKKKAVKKAPLKKAPAKRKGKVAKSSDDDMEIDDDASAKPTKKRKRQADDDTDKPAKKRREETDPWKLNTKAVKKDWTQMQAPPLEMFHFARKVIDEYTYLDQKDLKILTMVKKLSADRHWVLSGTPPVEDFGSVKTIAALLNIHLGVDDDAEGTKSVVVKKRIREQTAVEKFHSFREVRSLDWHAHRHEIGQRFLNQFVRQNIAEIDEIPFESKMEKISQPAAERAIYLELEHYLRAQEMTNKRGKKGESDRDKRLAKILGESSTAEEALIKRCSHFDLERTDEENAMKACEVIVRERTSQLDDCKKDLLKHLKEALKMHKEIASSGEENAIQEYIRICRKEGVGDKDATEIVLELLDEAGAEGVGKAKVGKSKGPSEKSNKLREKEYDLREKTNEIRKITKELVGRTRSLRYFRVVRDLQKQGEARPSVSCPGCDREDLPLAEIGVLSSCGHMGCLSCVTTSAGNEECVYAASGACSAAARVLNIVRAETLGEDDEERDGKGRHFGKKLEKVMELIKVHIPKKERVLIFVQFPDLTKKVADALTTNKIPFLEIKGSSSTKSKALEAFQENTSGARVLLLNSHDESASGANLTCANHAIFLSPLLAMSQEEYVSKETQAIGRVRRYGQTQLVHVWRFLTLATIDVEIYQQRTGETVV